MIRRPPSSTQSRSSAASDVYKRQVLLYDFEILHDESVAPNVIHMVNMDSPALTSALPLARRAVKILVDKEHPCLLYTSDAADDLPCVDLGGRRILQKKTPNLS